MNAAFVMVACNTFIKWELSRKHHTYILTSSKKYQKRTLRTWKSEEILIYTHTYGIGVKIAKAYPGNFKMQQYTKIPIIGFLSWLYYTVYVSLMVARRNTGICHPASSVWGSLSDSIQFNMRARHPVSTALSREPARP